VTDLYYLTERLFITSGYEEFSEENMMCNLADKICFEKTGNIFYCAGNCFRPFGRDRFGKKLAVGYFGNSYGSCSSRLDCFCG